MKKINFVKHTICEFRQIKELYDTIKKRSKIFYCVCFQQKKHTNKWNSGVFHLSTVSLIQKENCIAWITRVVACQILDLKSCLKKPGIGKCRPPKNL